MKLERDMRKALAEYMAVGREPAARGLALKRAAQDDEPGTAMMVEFASQRGTCGIAT